MKNTHKCRREMSKGRASETRRRKKKNKKRSVKRVAKKKKSYRHRRPRINAVHDLSQCLEGWVVVTGHRRRLRGEGVISKRHQYVESIKRVA
jgi:hypothetical protein